MRTIPYREFQTNEDWLVSAPDLAGCRILLIEDEFLIALDIVDALEAAGAEVSGPHATLAAAQEAALNEMADFAILDIDLKGEEVYPAAEQLRGRSIPFLFYTGQPERETLRNRFAEIPVFEKPSSPEMLVRQIASLLVVAA